MNSTLIDLRNKLPQGMVNVYGQVQDSAEQLELDVLVVGAMARDLVLVHGFGADLERGTRDIDFAVQVRDWESFEKLSKRLIAKGFRKAEKIAHRFYIEIDEMPWEIDLVPFGGVADDSGNIQWPPDQTIEMSVLGFDEAFKESITVQIGDKQSDLNIQVVSPAGMAMLKLIAWLDRSPELRGKDAKDIKYLLKTYEKIPLISKRIFDEGDMELHDWDSDRASANILGRDIAKIVSDDAYEFMQEYLFSKSEKLDILLREMTPKWHEIKYEDSALKVLVDAVIKSYPSRR